MKLRQNGTVSLMIKQQTDQFLFSIRPAVFLAGGWADT
jgi:hypothetical protein